MSSFFANLFVCCQPEKKDKTSEVKVEVSSPMNSLSSSPAKKILKSNLNTSFLTLETSISVNKKEKRRSSLFKDSAIFLSNTSVFQTNVGFPEYIPQVDYVSRTMIPKDASRLSITNVIGDILSDSISLNILKGIDDKCKIIHYFWLQREQMNNMIKKDFELNYSHTQYSSNYLFMICYLHEQNSYKLVFNHSLQPIELSNFILIQVSEVEPSVIFPGTILVLDKIKIQLNPMSNCMIEIINLMNQKRYQFNSMTKKIITIGSGEKCDLSYQNVKNLSKINTTVFFDIANKQWMLIDGFNDEKSKEGTWIFTTHPIKIQNEMNMKLWDKKIKFTIVCTD